MVVGKKYEMVKKKIFNAFIFSHKSCVSQFLGNAKHLKANTKALNYYFSSHLLFFHHVP